MATVMDETPPFTAVPSATDFPVRSRVQAVAGRPAAPHATHKNTRRKGMGGTVVRHCRDGRVGIHWDGLSKKTTATYWPADLRKEGK